MSIQKIILSTIVFFSLFAVHGQSQKFVPRQRLISSDGPLSARLKGLMTEKKISFQKLRTEQTVYLLDFSKVRMEEDQIDEFLNSLPFNVVEKNQLYQTQTTPDDEFFESQWALENNGPRPPIQNSVAGVDVGILESWNLSQGDPDLLIAVVDTGVDYSHQDLKENIWINHVELNGRAGVDDDGNGYIDDIHGYNFVDDNGDPRDGNSHGTHCAGVIGAIADNGIGIAGILNRVRMLPVKFLSDGGSGTTAAAIEAVSYAVKMNSDVISNSWGGGGFSQLLENEIALARDKGIVFVVAAGNNGTNNDRRKRYPANYDLENIIVVASHDSRERLASSSNYGAKSVHLAAPGVLIYSTIPGDRYGYKSGTSMATPHVSAAIGMLYSYSGSGNLNFSDLKTRLEDTTLPVSSFLGKIKSSGRLSISRLLNDIRSQVERPDPTLWREYHLPTPFESEHPYANDLSLERTIEIPGARFLKVVVNKMELEDFFDFFNLYNGDGELLEKMTGTLNNETSLVIAGNKVRLQIQSDFVKNEWGILVDKIQWQ
jgi:hypothetical protein